MMKFRRSMKSDSGKHDSTKNPVQISIPQKDAIAIEPPKKVIKALYDYNAPTEPPHYLSFSAGDFLHVVSRENDADWYEACNPLLGTRGLVPVKYFQEVGKTVRDSAGSTRSANHDSGYAENSRTSAAIPRSNVQNGMRPPPPQQQQHQQMSQPIQQQQQQPSPQQSQQYESAHRPSKSVSKLGGVYGIVAYDFVAERPDELDAKAGEAIIVIAQSNPEWFVAKPITRLGGPGLIPVSFIEIRDMTSGVKVDDPAAAVAKAGIPRVEDWKKMAADYKNTSIPLGQVSQRDQPSSTGLEQGMGRMSVSQQEQQADVHSHQRAPSANPYQPQQENFIPVRASVPRFTFADGKFHFVVECRLSNGAHWDLSRIYEDFYDLQISLISAFPAEAGQVTGQQRSLPYMPGPVKFVTDNITEGRRANLDEYLRDLLKMSPHITSSSLVRSFFNPRDGDYEVDPGAVDLEEHARAMPAHARQASQSQNGYATNGYGVQEQPQQAQYSQLQTSDPYGHQRGQASQSAAPQAQQGHMRSASQYSTHSPSHNATSSISAQASSHISNTSISNPIQPTSSNAASSTNTAPVKVKAWFDRDTCVVIRMPARGHFTFDELYNKIVERRRLEFKSQASQDNDSDQLDIEYRDEKDGEYYRLEGDEDLEIAVERNEKLTLAVRAARPS